MPANNAGSYDWLIRRELKNWRNCSLNASNNKEKVMVARRLH